MIRFYLHLDKHKTQWHSWHELGRSRPWPADPDAIGWITTDFINQFQSLPGSENYFVFQEWHSDIPAHESGFYLSHHGNSKAMSECFGLSTLMPTVRDQINQGKLTLLVAFVFESFDGKLTMAEWQDKFCGHLTEIGITRAHSVKVMMGTWSDRMQQHQDPRVQWIYYPFFETCVQVQARRMNITPSHWVAKPRPYKFLHLVRTPRQHRYLAAMCLEYLGVANLGLRTWPHSWPGGGVDHLSMSPSGVYEIGLKNFSEFRKFARNNKIVSASSYDSYQDLSWYNGGSWFDVAPWYSQCQLDFINETHHCIGNSVFLTEKTFRSLCLGIPFVILGSRQSLVAIKELGYQTFDSVWSEYYDQETSPMHSVVRTCELIRDLCMPAPGNPDPLLNPRLENIVRHNQAVFWNRDHAQGLYNALSA